MSVVMIEAKMRDSMGSRNAKQLRKEGMVPGVFYTNGQEAVHLVFDHKNILSFLHHTHALVDIKVEGTEKPQKCVLKDVQMHPVTEKVVHVDFLGIRMDRMIKIEVPIYLKGDPEGVKLGGMLQQPLRELEVECMPEFLPDRIEIDVSHLEIGDSIHVKDVQLENIRILSDESEAIALVELNRVAVLEEVEEEVEAAEDEELEEDAEEKTED